MASAANTIEQTPRKKSKAPIIIGFTALLLGGALGLSSVYLGLLDSPVQMPEANPTAPSSEVGSLVFVPLDPIIASLTDGENRYLLKFVATIEVNPAHAEEVEKLKPRIVDIINGYLRALELKDFEEPGALMKIRSHLFHRVRVVAGEGRINDLLIIEFVIN